jgi:hypothetical protein
LLIIYGAVAVAVVVAYFHLIVKERKTVVVEHSPLRISFPLAAGFGAVRISCNNIILLVSFLIFNASILPEEDISGTELQQ